MPWFAQHFWLFTSIFSICLLYVIFKCTGGSLFPRPKPDNYGGTNTILAAIFEMGGTMMLLMVALILGLVAFVGLILSVIGIAMNR